jgi:cysteine-rich repeat protein
VDEIVDPGRNHEPHGGDVCGNIFSTTETAPACAGLGGGTADVSGAPLDLQTGRVYEVVVFQAERHTCQSNYRLTISNFARRRSACAPVCGDAVLVGTELCDDGVNDGSYGGCAPDCSRGPRCGDAVVDVEAGEQCDNGSNLDQYYLCGPDGRDATGQACTPSCGPGCTWPGSCGDGVVQANFAESCDLGAEGNVSGYNGCNPDCSRGPHCGDGVVAEAEGEECDDGNNRPNDNCSPNCKHERPVGAR